MERYFCGAGEKRIVTVDFTALIPGAATIQNASARVETLAGVPDATNFAITNVQANTPEVTLMLDIYETAPEGVYQLEVEATLDNGEEVQGRDANGYAMILVVRP